MRCSGCPGWCDAAEHIRAVQEQQTRRANTGRPGNGGKYDSMRRSEAYMGVLEYQSPTAPRPRASFNSMVAELAAFHEIHDRKPKLAARDPKEKRLAAWLITQVRYARGINGRFLTAEQREKLDTLVPWWDHDPFNDYTTQAGEFVRRTGKLPAQTAKDPHERTLGIFLRDARVWDRQRPAGDPEVAEKRRMLDETVPGWRGVDLEVAWRGNLEEVFDFQRHTGRVPSTVSSDPDEVRLARWRAKMNGFAAKGSPRISPERRALVQQAIGEEPELAAAWSGFLD